MTAWLAISSGYRKISHAFFPHTFHTIRPKLILSNRIAIYLIVIATFIRAILSYRAGYYWDDFIIIAKTQSDPFAWHTLWRTYDGHTMPAAIMLIAAVNRIAPYHWWVPATILVLAQLLLSYGVWLLCQTINAVCENLPTSQRTSGVRTLSTSGTRTLRTSGTRTLSTIGEEKNRTSEAGKLCTSGARTLRTIEAGKTRHNHLTRAEYRRSSSHSVMLYPLIFWLFSPLSLIQNVWWSAGANTFPLCLGIVYCLIFSLRAHFLGTRRTQAKAYLCISTIIVVLAILCYEKSIIIPGVILVSLWLIIDRTSRTSRTNGWLAIVYAWKLWWYWALMTLGSLSYGIWAWQRISAVPGNHNIHDALTLSVVGAKLIFPVMFFGGPWTWQRWLPGPPIAFPTPILSSIAMLISAYLVYVLWKRGMFVFIFCVVMYYFGTILPITYARSSQFTSILLTGSLRYFADFAIFITIMTIIGLKFPKDTDTPTLAYTLSNHRLPVVLRKHASTVPLRKIARCSMVMIIGGCLSMTQFYSTITINPSSEYIANLRQEIQHQAEFFDQVLPESILTSLTWPNNRISTVFSALHPQIVTAKADGKILGNDGHLHNKKWHAIRHITPTCANTWYLDGPLIPFEWLIKIDYNADHEEKLIATLPGYPPISLHISPQIHHYYLRLSGGGDRIAVTNLQPKLCITSGEVYAFNPL